MLKKLLGYTQPSVQINEGLLILSLTDAMTPVMWVIDLNKNPTLLFKINEEDSGLFVLQKILPEGKTNEVEDLAYYKKRKHAIRAMEKTMDALHKNKASCGIALWKSCVNFGVTIITLVGVIAAIIYFTDLDLYFIETALNEILNNTVNLNNQATGPTTVQDVPLIPTPPADLNATGVPLSADDFLQQKPSSGLPF